MYTPSDEVLAKYAALLVRYALSGGKGIQKNDVVQLTVPDCAKPLLPHLLREVLQSGGQPKIHFVPTQMDRVFFENAQDHQLTFFPEDYKKAEAELINHSVSILSDANPQELQGIDSSKMFRALDARRKQRDWLHRKEDQGKFSWTLGLYGTEAMAKEAGLTLEEYWHEIIHACFLDTKDPIAEWMKVQAEQDRVKKELNLLKIQLVHIESKQIDLHIRVGSDRQWLGGSCRNIPSYEIFVSPDWRGANGHITFNQPLYRYGNILRDVSLEFKDGVVVKADAKEGREVLEAMISRRNANKIGEFSLTDRRASRITKFMANTLYDENIGGPFGNTHIALGRAYKESFTGVIHEATETDWENWGFNDSPEHTDIISTEDRTVTATLSDGSKKVIFKDGEFRV